MIRIEIFCDAILHNLCELNMYIFSHTFVVLLRIIGSAQDVPHQDGACPQAATESSAASMGSHEDRKYY